MGKGDNLIATIVTRDNSRKSPEKQTIKHKDPQCDKPEIIQNNPAEIKQQDKIKTIEIKQNTVNKEQKYVHADMEELKSDQDNDITKKNGRTENWK